MQRLRAVADAWLNSNIVVQQVSLQQLLQWSSSGTSLNQWLLTQRCKVFMQQFRAVELRTENKLHLYVFLSSLTCKFQFFLPIFGDLSTGEFVCFLQWFNWCMSLLLWLLFTWSCLCPKGVSPNNNNNNNNSNICMGAIWRFRWTFPHMRKVCDKLNF